MTTRAKGFTNRVEKDMSKRMLAVETLSAAITKDRCSMLMALGMLEGTGMFSSDEVSYARQGIELLQNTDEALRRLYSAHLKDERIFAMHVSARTLAEEIAVIRESAFWLLGADGMLAAEKLLLAQLRAYGNVRVLLRVLMAKDMDVSPMSDPPPLPAVPVNPYFKITHPELLP